MVVVAGIVVDTKMRRTSNYSETLVAPSDWGVWSEIVGI